MATTVTVKGQVTLPKAAREAAGIKPGDRVNVRVLPEGGVVVEKAEAAGGVQDTGAVEARKRQIEQAVARLQARGVKPSMSADELMKLTRGVD
jgi:AbrB family looped-hinge helix DNA binding protein